MIKKKIALLLSIVLIFCISCSQQEGSEQAETKQSPETSKSVSWVGKKVLPFTLTEATTSEEINISDLIGKKVIYITWWATWCKACVEEIPELKHLYSKFKDKGLEIVSINVKESKTKVAKYVKKKEVPYLNVLDLDGAVSKMYKVVGIPVNVVIDKNGVIQYFGSTVPANAEALIAKLTTELGNNNPSEKQEKVENNPSTSSKYKKAPDFNLKDIDGKDVSFSSYKDKVIILNFWATWCPPCRMEIPHLKELQKEYGSKGLQVIAISVDKTGVDSVKKFAEKNKMNYPVLMSTKKVILDYNGTQNISIPRTFIIDKKGNILETLVGLRDKKFFDSIISKLI